MALSEPLLPGRPPIAGYGSGMFRIAGVEHRGSLMILPRGVFAWPVADALELSEATLTPVLDAGPAVGFLLLGTGAA